MSVKAGKAILSEYTIEMILYMGAVAGESPRSVILPLHQISVRRKNSVIGLLEIH